MALFKYLHPDRVGVVDSCMLRFTQPGALNDPFELRPQFDSLIDEAKVLDGLATAPIDLGPMVEQAYALLPDDQRKRLPLDSAMQFLQATFETPEGRGAAAAELLSLLRSMPENAAPVREQIYAALNRNVGILSLSEVADHELMWAHYAESHSGFVLGFDERHAYFRRKRFKHDEFFHLRKVIYSDAPPSPSMSDVDGDRLLVTKGTRWSYEREWRMIVPLTGATRSITGGKEPVHLFSFPADALRAVILGAHATSALKKSMRDMLMRPELRHVRLTCARLDLNTRSVLVSEPCVGPRG